MGDGGAFHPQSTTMLCGVPLSCSWGERGEWGCGGHVVDNHETCVLTMTLSLTTWGLGTISQVVIRKVRQGASSIKLLVPSGLGHFACICLLSSGVTGTGSRAQGHGYRVAGTSHAAACCHQGSRVQGLGHRVTGTGSWDVGYTLSPDRGCGTAACSHCAASCPQRGTTPMKK